MNALIFASVVPEWLKITGGVIGCLIGVVLLFVLCYMRANIKTHEDQDETIDPEDFR